MKGILLAGGSGTRLYPATQALSKQLLPVYDKPMVYYPLSTLMLAGITDILLICRPIDQSSFERLLGDGSQLGISIKYAEQAEPKGLAEAFIIGADHIGDDSVALALGDNVFHGPNFARLLQETAKNFHGCLIFSYQVSDPERYGVVEVDKDGVLLDVVEKPIKPKTNQAITGLYYVDAKAVEFAKSLSPSERGELEMVDVIKAYIARKEARVQSLGRGFAWLDTGTHDSLIEAGHYVQVLEHQQGYRIGCIEEVALRMGYITPHQCARLGFEMGSGDYAKYVIDVATQFEESQLERLDIR